MNSYTKPYKSIDISEIDNILGQINLIDIREPHEFKASHIRTAINIPMEQLLSSPSTYLNKNEHYYLMCRSGHKSAAAYKELSSRGYTVWDITSGIELYEGKYRVE